MVAIIEEIDGMQLSEVRADRIDAVLFDYGQVLSGPPDPVAWARMCAVAQLDSARLHASYWEYRHDYDRGALTGETYWQAVARHAGVEFDAAQVAEMFAVDVDLWTELNRPMVEWAARLQRAGMRTGILSNIGDAIAEGVIARLPWLTGFDHCTWSHALFMAKPEPAIYIRTAEALGVQPANIFFIDDREENVVAAAGVGMQAIQYAAHGEFEREMRQRGLGWLLEARLGGVEGSHGPLLAASAGSLRR
jgi:putative hydrolase of the HAD superfamily